MVYVDISLTPSSRSPIKRITLGEKGAKSRYMSVTKGPNLERGDPGVCTCRRYVQSEWGGAPLPVTPERDGAHPKNISNQHSPLSVGTADHTPSPALLSRKTIHLNHMQAEPLWRRDAADGRPQIRLLPDARGSKMIFMVGVGRGHRKERVPAESNLRLAHAARVLGEDEPNLPSKLVNLLMGSGEPQCILMH
jgi:hypothetical protein